MRDGFIIHQKTIDQIKEMSAEQAGELLKAMIGHYTGEELEEQSQLTKILMVDVSERMDADAEAYEKSIQQKKEAASKRWNKDADGMRRDADACARIAEDMRTDAEDMRTACEGHAENAVSVSVSVSDSDSVSDSVSESVFKRQKEVLSVSNETDCQPEADAREAVERWNTLGVCPVERVAMSSKRGQMLRARIKEYGIDKVLDAIDNVRESEYLRGQNKSGWTITFDWFVKPNNFIKVLEGQYKSRGKPTSGSAYIDAINNRFDVVDEWLASKEAT